MVGLTELTEIRVRVVSAARSLEPDLLAPLAAQAMLCEVTAIANAASIMQALLARRVADGGGWRQAGDRSPEEHLARHLGTTPGKAKEALETAGRLEELGATNHAARGGELSPEQAAAVSDAATAEPTAEQRLLDTAKRGSLQDLNDESARTKAAADPNPDDTHERRRRARSLRIWADRHGVAKLFGVTTVDQMAVIKAAVERRADQLFRAARRQRRREPRGAYLIDALEQICAEWMAAQNPGPADTDAPDPGPAPPPTPTPTPPATPKQAGPAGRTSNAPRYLGIVRVDLETLRRGWVDGDEICEITGLGPVPVSVARRLLGDSVLHLVLTSGTAVGTTVNLRRGPTTAQRIALLATQPTCAITGCTSPFSEIDHVADWADTHTTNLWDLERKCTHHHALKTAGWATLRHNGITCMVGPDDPRHPGRARPRNHSPPAEPAA